MVWISDSDTRHPRWRMLQAAVIYFTLVFGAGFILGPVRVLWLVPRVGERAAELIEAPIMLAVIFLVARWLIQRPAATFTLAQCLVTGVAALAMLLVVEFSLVLWLRGLTIGEYLADRDPVALAVYVALLALFALIPALIRMRQA